VTEKKVSDSPVTLVVEKKEQIYPDQSEEMTSCVAQAEQQQAETSLSNRSTGEMAVLENGQCGFPG